MPLIDVFKIIAVVMLAIAFFVPKKKDYEYNALDKKGVILNIVLSVIYIPMSFAGVCMIFFADNPIGLTPIELNLLYTAIYFGISLPLVSVGSVFSSVVARKRGKSKFSFFVQFTPIVVFIIAIILWICAVAS